MDPIVLTGPKIDGGAWIPAATESVGTAMQEELAKAAADAGADPETMPFVVWTLWRWPTHGGAPRRPRRTAVLSHSAVGRERPRRQARRPRRHRAAREPGPGV